MDFQLGCNYWASHAGVYMWRNWDRAVVEADLARLSRCGVNVLRVFPLWPDFQPLTRLLSNGGSELRRGDTPLDRTTPEGLAGVDAQMMHRFEELLSIAEQHRMCLIVPLITGWMSGRMFYPPAFEARNPITDYETVKWEIRFVKYFVRRFKDYRCILAWEPGNETNVMSFCDDGWKQGDYWVWLSHIVHAIRSEDPTRPVYAGMHGLSLHGESGAAIAEVGELCDMLTVHPYPPFVPHCSVDGLDSRRAMLHGTAEALYYADISGRPCLCEEIGTLGSSLGDEETAARYLRANLYALWSHGSAGLLWWCACDQTELDYPPYDWCACERELGLLRADGSLKPVAAEMQAFREFLRTQPPLTPHQRDAVCILSRSQNNWAAAYSTQLLCKQAGLDVRFTDGEDPLPDSPIYLLPSLTGDAIPKRTWRSLMERAKDGALVYVSWQDAVLSSFEAITGLRVQSNAARAEAQTQVDFPEMALRLTLSGPRRLALLPLPETRVLGTEPDGNPVFAFHPYGKGGFYFLSFPLETMLADQPRAFDGTAYYRLYQCMFSAHTDRKVMARSLPELLLTEHPVSASVSTVIALNYGPETRHTLTLRPGWQLGQVVCGHVTEPSPGTLCMEAEPLSLCRFTVKADG